MVETANWLASKGVANTVGMNKGGTFDLGGVQVTMTHADHSCGITDGDQTVYGGEAVGYVITFESGLKVYAAGDTNVFSDMAIIGDLYQPDVALLPIGDFYTMGPREAAYAMRLLGAPAVVPMHYATFPALTGTPGALREALGAFGLSAVEVLGSSNPARPWASESSRQPVLFERWFIAALTVFSGAPPSHFSTRSTTA